MPNARDQAESQRYGACDIGKMKKINQESATMNIKGNWIGAFMLLAAANASALDAACIPILTASEGRMKLASWHSVTIINGNMHMENMKVNGMFFRQVGGAWMKSTINFDTAESDMLAQIRSGEVKLSQCKAGGFEMVDGVPVSVVSYRVEMKGAPAADSKLFIGKLDGLPYKQIGQSVNVSYKYKNISAPKL